MIKLTQEQLLFAKGIGATHISNVLYWQINEDCTAYWWSPSIGMWVSSNKHGDNYVHNFIKIDFSPLDNKEDELQKPKHNKYMREIKPGVWVDIYDVLQAWKITNPAQQHLAKKALQGGQRGHKNYETDMRDIIASATRAIELERATQELEK